MKQISFTVTTNLSHYHMNAFKNEKKKDIDFFEKKKQQYKLQNLPNLTHNS